MAEGKVPAGSQPMDDPATGAAASSEAESGAVWRDNLYCVSVPPAGRRRLYRVHSQLFIKLDFDLDLPQSGRRGDDMVLRFDNGSEVVFEGFVPVADRDPTLHLLPPDGSLLPGDTVAAGLDALLGPPPALTTERPGAAGPRVHEAPAAAPDETPATPAEAPPAERPSDWPAQAILDDLQAKGLPVPAADGESAEAGAPDEPSVSAADLVSQVAEALPDFGPPSEPAPELASEPAPAPQLAPPQAAPAPQPSPAAPPQEEAAPQDAPTEAFGATEPAPETVVPPTVTEAEVDAPAAAAAPPEAAPAVDDGTVWADELLPPDAAPAPQPEAPMAVVPQVEEGPQPDAPLQEAAEAETVFDQAPIQEEGFQDQGFQDAEVQEAAVQDVWTPQTEAQDRPAEELPLQEAPAEEPPQQEAIQQATDPQPEAELPPGPPEPADGGLGADVRFLPEQSLEDLLPPELLGQEPLPGALQDAPLPAAPAAQEPHAPAAANPAPPPFEPAVWAGDPAPPMPVPDPAAPPPAPAMPETVAPEPASQPPEPLPPEPFAMEDLAAELAPQAAAEAVWEDAESWPAAPQAPTPASFDEAPLAEPAQPDLPPAAPALPATAPDVPAESWDPAAAFAAAPPAPMPPSEAQAAVEPTAASTVEPPAELAVEPAAEPPWAPAEDPLPAQAEAAAPAAPALPDSQGGFYPAAAPFAPAEGHWQVAPPAAEADVPAPAPAATFDEDPGEPVPAPEARAEAEAPAWNAPVEAPAVPDPVAAEKAEPVPPAGDPAPAMPDPEMVVKATQILAAFEQLSAVGAASEAAPEGEPLAEAPEFFAPEPPAPELPAPEPPAPETLVQEPPAPEPFPEGPQAPEPGSDEPMPAFSAPALPDGPAPDESAAPAGLPQTDAALPAEAADEPESPAADEAAAHPEAEGPQGQAGGGLLRSAVANVLRARSLILPGRGPEVVEDARDEEEEALPADSEADGPRDGVLELTDSYEEPASVPAAEPQVPGSSAAAETGAPDLNAPDMNAMDLFADPVGEDLPDLAQVPVGEELTPKVPSFLTEPTPIETARRTGGKVKEIPAEVRDAVMVALHGMEEEDLFDFDGEARPPEAEAGQMVAVPIDAAARPVGVIFADKDAPGAPGGQEGEALPGAGESGQLPD